MTTCQFIVEIKNMTHSNRILVCFGQRWVSDVKMALAGFGCRPFSYTSVILVGYDQSPISHLN